MIIGLVYEWLEASDRQARGAVDRVAECGGSAEQTQFCQFFGVSNAPSLGVALGSHGAVAPLPGAQYVR
jgi:hypothetical protein